MNHCVNFLLLSIILKFHVNSPWTQHELNIIIGSRGLVYTCERIQMVEKWAWDHFIIVIGKIRWAKSDSIKFRLTQKPPVDRFWQPQRDLPFRQTLCHARSAQWADILPADVYSLPPQPLEARVGHFIFVLQSTHVFSKPKLKIKAD